MVNGDVVGVDASEHAHAGGVLRAFMSQSSPAAKMASARVCAATPQFARNGCSYRFARHFSPR